VLGRRFQYDARRPTADTSDNGARVQLFYSGIYRGEAR
jgi:hypothetical protein